MCLHSRSSVLLHDILTHRESLRANISGHMLLEEEISSYP